MGLASTLRACLPVTLRRHLARLGNVMGSGVYLEGLPDMEACLRSLHSSGFSPKTILDVGTYEGAWTQTAKRIWPDARITMVEGLAAKAQCLQRVQQDWLGTVSIEIAVVGREEGREVFFHVMETGSSVYEELSTYPRTHEPSQCAPLIPSQIGFTAKPPSTFSNSMCRDMN